MDNQPRFLSPLILVRRKLLAWQHSGAKYGIMTSISTGWALSRNGFSRHFYDALLLRQPRRSVPEYLALRFDDKTRT